MRARSRAGETLCWAELLARCGDVGSAGWVGGAGGEDPRHPPWQGEGGQTEDARRAWLVGTARSPCTWACTDWWRAQSLVVIRSSGAKARRSCFPAPGRFRATSRNMPVQSDAPVAGILSCLLDGAFPRSSSGLSGTSQRLWLVRRLTEETRSREPPSTAARASRRDLLRETCSPRRGRRTQSCISLNGAVRTSEPATSDTSPRAGPERAESAPNNVSLSLFLASVLERRLPRRSGNLPKDA